MLHVVEAVARPGLSVQEIEHLYDRHGALVLTRCRALLDDEAAARDAMHQTFVRALKHRRSFSGAAAPRSWLYTICTRVCLDELAARARRRRLAARAAIHFAESGCPSPTCALEDRREVARLLARFDPDVQAVVRLRYFAELEVRDIAAHTGLSERTVARRLAHFLERARCVLEAEARRAA